MVEISCGRLRIAEPSATAITATVAPPLAEPGRWVVARLALAGRCVIVALMVLPGQPPPRPPGRGPFGEKAFRGALAGCVVLIVVGLPAAVFGSGPLASVGTSLLVLGLLGLVTSGVGLLAERQLHRRPPASGR